MSNKTLLLVEDDPDIRTTLKEVLELEGYSVLSAANGKEAYDLLKTSPKPCLILLDLMMPVMNGWEFLEAQQSHAKIANVPVIVVSAAGDKAKSAKAHGFIKKPIEVDGLLEMIERFC